MRRLTTVVQKCVDGSIIMRYPNGDLDTVYSVRDAYERHFSYVRQSRSAAAGEDTLITWSGFSKAEQQNIDAL